MISKITRVDNKILVTGAPFYSSCNVYVDGQEVKSNFDGKDTLYVDLTANSSIEPNKSHQVEVRVYDDKKMKIGQSNLYPMPSS
ncbi:hypothetical protein D3C86_1938620 [compost metagenome]